MKRVLLLQMILLSMVCVNAEQHNQQTEFELNCQLDENGTYSFEATSYIKLMDGFKCNPSTDNCVLLSLNRYGVFPPENGFLGGPPSSNKDGVVGALPGSLTVSDVGGAVYNIPLQFPKGIGDMTPNLSVTYNNQAGNGLLGWGWEISGLSSIERTGKTMYHDGKIGKVKYDSDDVFVLDGKRLMLCNSIPYGCDGATYRTEIDELSKVVSYTRCSDDGPEYFAVYKSDGTIWEYGNSADSYVLPQNNYGPAASWLVNKISDRDGNVIVFHYDNINEEGESYINHIEYTLNVKQGVRSMYDVVFSYEYRTDIEKFFVYENMIQKERLLKSISVKDKLSGKELMCYSFDYLKPGYYDDVFYYYNRLHSIGLVADGMKLNPTVISWNKKRKHFNEKFQSHTLDETVFNKVPFCGDFNGDGFSDVILVPYKIGNSYYDDVIAEVYINNGDGSFEEKPRCTFTFEKSLEWIYVVDFDGDGLADVVPYYCNEDKEYVWRTKASFYKNNGDVSFSKIGGDLTYDRRFWFYPGDFCGEHRVSFFVQYENNSFISFYLPSVVYYDNGSICLQTLDKSSSDYMPMDVLVEDLNGDGMHEIIYLMDDCSTVANIVRQNGVLKYNHAYVNYEISNDDYLFPGDFNGDGNVDFVKYNTKTLWSVVLSDGKKLLPKIPFLNTQLFNGVSLSPQDKYRFSLSQLSAPSVTIRTADFDGDGRCDVGLFKNFGGNFYMVLGSNMFLDKSGKMGFGYMTRYYLGINFAHQFVHVGNFLGQENQSILGTVEDSPPLFKTPKIVALNPVTSMYSVERITDGLGNVHGLSYGYLMPYKGNKLYSFEFQWLSEDLRTVGLPLKALRSDTTYTTNNTPYCHEYSYLNAVCHIDGHGVLGFMKSETSTFVNKKFIQRKCIDKQLETLKSFGMILPLSISIFDSGNKIINTEHFVYDKFRLKNNPKVVIPVLVKAKKLFYDLNGSCDVVKTEVTENEYSTDEKGGIYTGFVVNAKNIVGVGKRDCGFNASACDFKTTTDYAYQNDVDRWIVNRISSIRCSKEMMKEQPVGYCELFDYEDSTNPLRVTGKTSIPNINWDKNDSLTIVTTYSYDKVGHIVEQTLSSKSASAKRNTKVGYSSDNKFKYPTSFVNENGLVLTNSYDDDFGLSCSTADYNGFVMLSKDDVLGITTLTTMPDGIEKIKTKRWASGNKHAPKNAMYYCWEKSTGNAESMVFYHKNGKELRNVTFGLNGEPIYVDMLYDDFGNMSAKSLPYTKSENIEYLYFVFDEYNRITEEIFPNGLKHEYQYGKYDKIMTTITPDGDSQTKKEVVNVMGWVVEYQDVGGNVIVYDYFSDGMMKCSQIGGNTATKVLYEYDNRRKRTKLDDPSSGATVYQYDAFGNLIKSISPKSATTYYEYDSSGNLLSRKIDDGSGDVVVTHWIYDDTKGEKGMLKRILHGDSHLVEYSYDKLLRMTSVRETICNVDYRTDYEYDEAGREFRKSYPSGVQIETKYSNSGFARSIVDMDDGMTLWNTNTADSWGNITDYQIGNGLRTRLEYDKDLKFLKSIKTCFKDDVYQDLSYTYNYFGNMTNRSKYNGITVSESFEYDGFNRLAEIKLNGNSTGTMVYDELGNMLSKTINGVGVFYDAEFDNDDPYSIKYVKTEADVDGNMSQKIKYNAFDAISCASNEYASLSFGYGPDLSRDRMNCVANGLVKEKTYVGDCEFVKNDGVYTFISGPMGIFAVVYYDENNSKSIFYIHKDHLGSWCLITDEDLKIIQETSYDAWGNLRNPDKWNGKYDGDLLCDRGFTGHEHVMALGLINMNGRLYDPFMSMMLSPDNYIQDPYFSQNYNRYRYCYNNPLSYNDPTGELAAWLAEGIFWGAMNVITHMNDIDDIYEGLMMFGAGFLYGSLTHGLGECSWLVQVVCATGTSVVKNGVNNIVRQNDGAFDWNSIDKKSLKKDLMYALGSGLASSMLNAYIVYPTENEAGVCLGKLICEDYKKGHILDTAVSAVFGNIFTNVSPFEGVDWTGLNVDWTTAIPNMIDALSMYFPDNKLVALLGGSAGLLTTLFGDSTNGNDGGNKGTLNKEGGKYDGMMNVIRAEPHVVCSANINAPVCYSSVRSLFLNK